LERDRDEFRIDLDDDPQYLLPIALVAQAHGTAFYEETIGELRSLSVSPGNTPLRGDLLASLLLIGDELDLHEERAAFPPEFSHSPISSLHHHMHHYVTRVEVVPGATPKYRRIRLTLQYPLNSEDYQAEIRHWLGKKLMRQCCL